MLVAIFWTILWFCVDDHLAVVFKNPQIGTFPILGVFLIMLFLRMLTEDD